MVHHTINNRALELVRWIWHKLDNVGWPIGDHLGADESGDELITVLVKFTSSYFSVALAFIAAVQKSTLSFSVFLLVRFKFLWSWFSAIHF